MQMALIANANGTQQSIDFRWFHRFSRTYRFLLDANKHDPVTFLEDLFLESVRQSGALLIAMDVCYPGLWRTDSKKRSSEKLICKAESSIGLLKSICNHSPLFPDAADHHVRMSSSVAIFA